MLEDWEKETKKNTIMFADSLRSYLFVYNSYDQQIIDYEM